MTQPLILTRRRFVKDAIRLAAGIVVIASPLEGFAVTAKSKHPMTFYHTHTGERLHIDYSPAGCSRSTHKKLNNFLCDFRTGEVKNIDPELLDVLYGIQKETGSRGVIEIISGYRSPKTNKMLRSKNRGVASKSMHLKGKAIDIRLTDLRSKEVRDVAISLQKGGVGYYAKSNFVYIDTGRVRTW